MTTNFFGHICLSCCKRVPKLHQNSHFKKHYFLQKELKEQKQKKEMDDFYKKVLNKILDKE